MEWPDSQGQVSSTEAHAVTDSGVLFPNPLFVNVMNNKLRQKALCAALLSLTALVHCSTAHAQNCTWEYAPVCGQLATEPAPQTFANRCLLDAAKAVWVSPGECNAKAKAKPLVGSDEDAHGCKASAGYQWNEELQQCVRPWMSQAVTLEVAAKRRACTGMIPMQCLLVRESVPGKALGKWEPLFVEIAGFTHVAGQRAKLRVRKDRLENPPADAPNTTYTLLKVLR